MSCDILQSMKNKCKQSGKPVRVLKNDTRTCCPICSQQVPVSKVRLAKGLYLNSGIVYVATVNGHSWH